MDAPEGKINEKLDQIIAVIGIEDKVDSIRDDVGNMKVDLMGVAKDVGYIKEQLVDIKQGGKEREERISILESFKRASIVAFIIIGMAVGWVASTAWNKLDILNKLEVIHQDVLHK